METRPALRSEPTSGRRQLRRTTSFQFLNSDAFAIFFLIISLCFIFIVLVSPFYSFSFSFHFFKPQFTRKSLDFLSLAMVLFAIACGLMSKNNGENTVHEEIYRASNASSNDSEQIHKSNPSIPNQWNSYADRVDQILLAHPPAVAGVDHWRLSGGDYTTNYQSLSSDSVRHCRNLKDFEEGFDFKRGFRGTISVYDEEISSSPSPLHQFSVPSLMTPSQLFSPPRAMVDAEVERINEGNENFEPPLLQLNFQAWEDEISKNEKKSDEGKELKNKKIEKKNKMKKWKKGVGNFNELLTPQHQHHRISFQPPPVEVHHCQTSIGDFPAPPQLPPQTLIAVRTQNSTGGEPPLGPLTPPSTAVELQIVMKEEILGTRNENAERKSTMFCGSPDVNRAGLKLERMNSIKERQRKTKTSILGRKGPEQ